MARTIRGAVGLNGQVYRAGMEDQLARTAEAAGVDLSKHVASGVLQGDWGGVKAKADDGAGEGPPADPNAITAAFPGGEDLIAAGLTTRDAVAAKTDEDLIALPGIGKATVAKIRDALK